MANFEYELPFGKGEPMLSNGTLSHIAGNWRVNGIATLQSGLPISITSRQNTTGSFGGVQRPNSTGLKSETAGSKKDRINGWLNPAAFVDTPAYTFGRTYSAR